MAVVRTGCHEHHDLAQASSSSKNAGPSIELVKGFAFSDFSGRTDNVFLSKIDALLPISNCKNSLSELLHA